MEMRHNNTDTGKNKGKTKYVLQCLLQKHYET